MRYATVCSGIEAPSVAWDGFGWEPAFFSEIEAFPCALLAHHYPAVQNLGDMRLIDGAAWRGKVDVLCAGTPCQAFSVAGLRQGLADHRGNLTLAFMELTNAIDPAVVLWENVPGVLSDRSNAFGCFLAGLVGADAPLVPPGEWGWSDAGVVAGPRRNVAWRVLDAQFVGLAQRRRRVYVVGFRAGARTHPAAVLLEPSSVRRDPAPRREARQEVAGTIRAGAVGGRSHGKLNGTDRMTLIPSVSKTLLGHAGYRGDEGFDASEDGTGRGTPLVAFSCKDHGADAGDVAPTLRSMGHDESHANGGGQVAIAFGWQNSEHQGDSVSENVTPTLDKSKTPAVLAPSLTTNDPSRSPQASEVTQQVASVFQAQSAVRRLTPRECERIQGFPDDYTLVPFRGKPATDGHRYRALGNSMPVNVIRWIGERISRALLNDGSEEAAA